MNPRMTLGTTATTICILALLTIAVDAQEQALALRELSPAQVSEMFEGPRPARWIPGEVIVKFEPGVPAVPADQLTAMGLGGEATRTSGGEMIYRLPAPAIGAMSAEEARAQTLDAIKTMQARPDVEYAQPNYLFDIFQTPNDPGYSQQWHYFDNGNGPGQTPGGINLPAAWDRTRGDPGVVVAVIDTGILPGHPDITGSGNLVTGFDMISNSFTANDGDGRDADPTDPGDAVAANECFPGSRARADSWHGTHVAGTVGVGGTDNGTGVAGVNWDVRVQAVRVLGKCGGSTADINDAMRWAAGLPVPGVPANATPAAVINLSLGADIPCSSSPSTQAAINDAVNAGATVVVAAGNSAIDASGALPAGCDNVITVAAADYNGRLVTRYSNFGNVVEILAPGGDVQADINNDGNPDGVLSTVQGGYAFYNGTSMAAPHVAGVAALVLAQDPTLTPQEVSDLITDNAIPRSNTQCSRPCGAGLLNADIAVVPGPGPGPTPPPPVLAVTPASLAVDEGSTETLTVIVTRGGSPQAGETVSFTSSDTSLATVSPATGTTDSAGRVQATVNGVAVGMPQIEVSAVGQTQTVAVNVVRRKFSALGLTTLVLLMGIVVLASAGRRARRPVAPHD